MQLRRTPAPRRWLVAASVAALAASGCTSGAGAERMGADGPTTTSRPSQVSDWIHEDPEVVRAKAVAALPEVCDLMPRPKLEELLGGPPKGVVTATDDGRSCLWRPVGTAADPTTDGADVVIALQIRYPPLGQSMDQFWAEGKAAATGPAEVDGCDDAFWVDGLLNARVDDYYVAGTAGLADPSPAALATSEALIEAICSEL